MVDILIRDVDKNTARRLKEKAKAKGVSLSEAAREALAAYVGTSKESGRTGKEEAWAAADAFRKKIGKVSGDSTQIIREWRDNDEPYR